MERIIFFQSLSHSTEISGTGGISFGVSSLDVFGSLSFFGFRCVNHIFRKTKKKSKIRKNKKFNSEKTKKKSIQKKQKMKKYKKRRIFYSASLVVEFAALQSPNGKLSFKEIYFSKHTFFTFQSIFPFWQLFLVTVFGC